MDIALVVITFYFVSIGKLCFLGENNGKTRNVVAWCPVKNMTLEPATDKLGALSVLPFHISGRLLASISLSSQ
jgi:hypothetical protein